MLIKFNTVITMTWVGFTLTSKYFQSSVLDCMGTLKHFGHWQLSLSQRLGYWCCSPLLIPTVIIVPLMSLMALTRAGCQNIKQNFFSKDLFIFKIIWIVSLYQIKNPLLLFPRCPIFCFSEVCNLQNKIYDTQLLRDSERSLILLELIGR